MYYEEDFVEEVRQRSDVVDVAPVAMYLLF